MTVFIFGWTIPLICALQVLMNSQYANMHANKQVVNSENIAVFMFFYQ